MCRLHAYTVLKGNMMIRGYLNEWSAAERTVLLHFVNAVNPLANTRSGGESYPCRRPLYWKQHKMRQTEDYTD
jgi:hypothetical protein